MNKHEQSCIGAKYCILLSNSASVFVVTLVVIIFVVTFIIVIKLESCLGYQSLKMKTFEASDFVVVIIAANLVVIAVVVTFIIVITLKPYLELPKNVIHLS